MKEVEPVIDPEIALTKTLPTAFVVKRPFESIVAMLGIEVLQAIEESDWGVPSVRVPEAANCCVSPSGVLLFTGVTVIVFRTGGATVKVIEDDIDPEVALIVAVPCATLVTNPDESTVATLVDEETQVTLTACVEPLLNRPLAASCCVVPSGRDGEVGEILIEESVGGGVGVLLPPPPHPEKVKIETASNM